MHSYQFENVRLILAQPNWQIRESLKSRLLYEGFRDIFTTDKLQHLRREVSRTAPDLIIADTGLPGGDVCDLFHGVRHHLVGENPFLPIIAVSRSTEAPVVHKVIDSGADDLLAMPISSERLIERIVNLVQRRKPFIVTSDYIGPDRRKDRRGESAIPLIEVPNSLKNKAVGDTDPEKLQEAVNAAVLAINEERITRHGVEVHAVVAQIIVGYEKNESAAVLRVPLERLLYLAEDISRRMAGTRYHHVADLCGSLLKVTGALLIAGPTPSPRDVRLLPELANAVESAFRLGQDAAAASHDISDSIARMGGR